LKLKCALICYLKTLKTIEAWSEKSKQIQLAITTRHEICHYRENLTVNPLIVTNNWVELLRVLGFSQNADTLKKAALVRCFFD